MKDKRPAFQFYVGDWMKDADLRACSYAARGLWTDMLCLMYESSRRGYLLVKDRPASQQHIARMTGGSSDEVGALLKELEDAGVFSRSADGAVFCRRMVRDEAAAARARANGQKGGNPVLVGKSDKGGVIPDSNPPHKPRDKHFVEDEEEDEDAVPSLSSGSNPLADFERWFNAYPQHRRTDYNGCLHEWADTHCDTCPADVLAGLEAWKTSEEWTKDGGKFVPAARKFLTTRKWESRPIAAEQPQDDSKARRRGESDVEYSIRMIQQEATDAA